jgi:outer membrane protein assembly factor BamD
VTSRTTLFKRGGKKKDESKKDSKVVQSKDTKKAVIKDKKAELIAGQDAKLPDKQLYDKAVDASKHGHFDVARLDLQTMLNTYPDSQYQMRAKLAIADSWYREGGTAALTQAESEYADFRVFFPNAPEAAEAQMRIGDIYFRQMDRPDRDYAKATHAEEEYRRMLTDYPDSALVPQAKQRLRDVQEVLASREADIASYYATRENWAAVIARDQTVVDTYPQYSHMDDVLVSLGDAYEAQARYVRTLKLAEGPKAKLEALYDGEAADAYKKVVLEHSAAPHVEDARDRLEAMQVPIPVPTKDQMDASAALENSRAAYRLQDRAMLMFMHKPDTVTAARLGEPALADPPRTVAPQITKKVVGDFNAAFGTPTAADAAAPAKAGTATAAAEAGGAAAPAAPAAPLQLNDVKSSEADATSGGSTGGADLTSVPPARTGAGGATGATFGGVEILNNSPNGTAADTAPGGLKAVGPANAAALPAAEKAAAAPDLPNEIAPGQAPAAQAARADGKKTKAPEFDKGDESSSKHKKKKGIKKIVPVI